MARRFLIIIDHIKGYQSTIQPLIAHQQGEAKQLRGYLKVLYTEQDLFIVLWCAGYVGRLIGLRIGKAVTSLGKDNLSRGVVGHQGRDDAGDKDHHHDTVEHVIVDKELSGSCFKTHAHHDHGDGTGSMGGGQAEHHVAVALWQSEDQTGDISCEGLSEGAEEGNEEDHPDDVPGGEDGAHVDEHAYTD